GDSDSPASGNKGLGTFGGSDAWLVKYSEEDAPAGSPLILVNGLYAQSNHVQIAFTNTALVVITSSIPAAHIYYTLDGTQPGPGTLRYLAPFSVTNSVTLKVLAMDAGESSQSVTFTNYVDFTPAYTLVDSTSGGGTVLFEPPLFSGPFLSNSL